MEFVEYAACRDRSRLRELLAQCGWRAGRYLAELLELERFAEEMGEGGRVFFLLEGDALVSFYTLTRRDCIDEDGMFPWIGFVYTAPEYRGRGWAGRMLAHAETAAAVQGHRRVYLATDHVGLYERYGYGFLECRLDRWGQKERILVKELKGEKET